MEMSGIRGRTRRIRTAIPDRRRAWRLARKLVSRAPAVASGFDFSAGLTLTLGQGAGLSDEQRDLDKLGKTAWSGMVPFEDTALAVTDPLFVLPHHVNDACSPEPPNPVRVKRFIHAEEDEVVHQRLRREEAIERIAVVKRQRGQSRDMADLDGEE